MVSSKARPIFIDSAVLNNTAKSAKGSRVTLFFNNPFFVLI